MNKIILIISLLLSLSAFSQEKTDCARIRITYNTTWGEWKNLKTKADVQRLEIGNRSSKFYSYWQKRTKEICDSMNRVGNLNTAEMIRKTKPYSGAQDYHVYKNFPQSGKLTFVSRVDMDVLKYEEDMPEFDWKIVEGDTVIAEYNCQAAVTEWRGRKWKAWFTTDIPISDGPWKLCGLPGLILKTTESENFFTFDCAGIEKIEETPIVLKERKYVDCTAKEYYKMERECRLNPFGYSDKRLGRETSVPESLQKTITDQNKPENRAKLLEIEYIDVK